MKQSFGRLATGEEAFVYTISCGGLTATVTDFGATLMINGEAVKDQSSAHVLYSGITSKWKIYSSTTTPPSEAGRYTMTVTVLGGNYLASPINRSFQITK